MSDNPYDPSQPPPVPPPGYPQQPYGQPPGYPPMGFDPAAPHGRDMYGRPLSSKSKVVAGVLQLVKDDWADSEGRILHG